ncbi:MAG TPA: DNA polymerase III subunit gamma/tau [Patescibacteria group bacterium]|jgi:DNA polymerase-3 subunit gamma/tau
MTGKQSQKDQAASRGALYRLHRPQTFAEVAGQDAVVGALRQAVASDRAGHAYLFTGPRGTGKTSTARILAKALNCPKRKQGEPCGRCDVCTAIERGSFLDLIEIDAASNRGIDEIRELRGGVAIAPTSGQRKVYLIDEVHMLTKEAWGALLKTLEEPPSFVTFILATTEPGKVPATISSRCQRFDFRPATPQALTDRLAAVAKVEKLAVEPEALEVVARAARGSFRDALSMLDTLAATGGKISAATAREALGIAGGGHLDALEQALTARDLAAALAAVDAAAHAGVAADVFRIALVERLRGRLHALAAGQDGVWQADDLVRALKLLLAAGDWTKDSPLPELPLELVLVEFIGTSDAGAVAPDAPSKPPAVTADPAPVQPSVAPEKPAQKPAAFSGTKPAGPPPKNAQEAKSIPRNAQELWEKLLTATKDRYSLSVCLQKTRPVGLKGSELSLSVQSEFFLQKLDAQATREAVETELKQLAGKDLALKLQLAEPSEDLFEDALKTFEGAEVQQ